MILRILAVGGFLLSGMALAQAPPPDQPPPAQPAPEAVTALEPAAEASAPAPEASAPAPPAFALVNILLHTALGDIEVQLEKDRAPVSVNNFLRYVDNRRFDGINFYRAVALSEDGKYGLIQGGLRSDPKKVFRPIAHESPAVTGLSHVDGAISMARLAPGTAAAEFFIVVGDLKAYDGKSADDPGYAVFGRVVSGMDVVRQILIQPRDTKATGGVMQGQMLAPPVKIITVRRTH
jgi:peptidyl-prolyl cis-trans isomerase A (cyclophilin A)